MFPAPSGFRHYDLALLNPSFDSPLLDVLTELEHLRRLELKVTTPRPVFVQLKRVFHTLESLASARIEGNHTTLADYVDERVAGNTSPSDQLLEIRNIEQAMEYVESVVVPGAPVPLQFVRELHALTVQGLQREGDRTPGAWRTGQVRIAQAAHLPPDALQVADYMEELAAFINRADPPKYDLMKVALAHHRFAWVHPFSNGNGRVVRLLTYALLIKYGFRVNGGEGGDGGRLLNPAAVFCNDRQRYYDMLARADEGSPDALEDWCTYALTGIVTELRKLDQLIEHDKLADRILLPAIDHAYERRQVTPEERQMLMHTVRLGVVKSGDLAQVMPKQTEAQRTYGIRKLVERGMLLPVREGARQYVIGFSSNVLLRGVVHALTRAGLIPEPVAAPTFLRKPPA